MRFNFYTQQKIISGKLVHNRFIKADFPVHMGRHVEKTHQVAFWTGENKKAIMYHGVRYCKKCRKILAKWRKVSLNPTMTEAMNLVLKRSYVPPNKDVFMESYLLQNIKQGGQQ